jgi:hypothetical protein
MPASLAEHLPVVLDCNSWNSLVTLACLHEWQDFWAGVLALLAGLLGFLAAIWAVRTTLQSERRKAHRDLDALKKGLGAEGRHFARNVYSGAVVLKSKLDSGEIIHLSDIESTTRLPSPVLYQGNSASLGFLGEQTPQIVLFYSQIDIIQQAFVRLSNVIDTFLATTPDPTPSDTISRNQVAVIVSRLIAACETAVRFLPSLKTGTSLDNDDNDFPVKVAALRADPESC